MAKSGKFSSDRSSAPAPSNVLKLPRELIEEANEQWRLSLVGVVVGSKPALGYVASVANRMWGKTGKVRVSEMGVWFVFQFENEKTLQWALERGPWTVGGEPLMLRRWSSGLRACDSSLKKFPVWVEFRNVPMVLYTHAGLRYLASVLGKFLYMDKSTEDFSDLDVAKVCVEIDIEKELEDCIRFYLGDGSVAGVSVSIPGMKCLKWKRPGQEPPRSWHFVEPQKEVGTKVLELPEEIIEEAEDEWGLCAVGVVLGSRPKLGYIASVVSRKWGKNRSVWVSRAGIWYVFQFADEESLGWALQGGPWDIGGHHLVLKRWTPELPACDRYGSLKKLPVWVVFKNVPMVLYTRNGLNYIASLLGKPLYMDRSTTNLSNLDVAKVCVEIEEGAELDECIRFDLEDGSFAEVSVSIPWMPKGCFDWKRSDDTWSQGTSIEPEHGKATAKNAEDGKTTADEIQDMCKSLAKQLELGSVNWNEA